MSIIYNINRKSRKSRKVRRKSRKKSRKSKVSRKKSRKSRKKSRKSRKKSRKSRKKSRKSRKRSRKSRKKSRKSRKKSRKSRKKSRKSRKKSRKSRKKSRKSRKKSRKSRKKSRKSKVSRKSRKKSRKSRKKLPDDDEVIFDDELIFDSDVRPERTGNCIERSLLDLKDHQLKAVNFLKNPENDALLVVHGTGCGKTLTAVTMSQCYLDENPDKKVVLVAPTSLLKNFEKELDKYGVTNKDRYHFYSFNKFGIMHKTNKAFDCKDAMLILDEVHNLRNFKIYDKKIKKKRETDRYKSALNCAQKADKRVLLTATPFVNSVQDFVPLINFVYGKRVLGDYTDFKNGEVENYIRGGLTEDNLFIIAKYLNKKVDFVKCSDSKYFPKVTEQYVNIEMPPAYKKKYDKLMESINIGGIEFKDPGAFFNAHRRAVNKAGEEYFSLKITKILPELLKGKSLIYTNWIDFGIKPITDLLKKKGISYGVFYGSISKKKRAELVNGFNNGEFDVLIITKAGGEGLDLKEVRNVIVMEPVWHQSGLEQIIGRAARFKSHENLPVKDRKVNVYKLVLTSPGYKNWEEEAAEWPKNMSGDAVLYSIINKKKIFNEEIVEVLKEISI